MGVPRTRPQHGRPPAPVRCVVRTGIWGDRVMVVRPVRRALTLAVVGALAIAGTAAADNLRADGDTVTAGAQTFVDLGELRPGATVTVPVAFELVCTSTTHPDPGQSITLTLGAQSAPAGGAVVSATTAVIGPVPAGWTADGTTCASP